MSTIFLDESGDLGFDLTKSRTSQFFVVTCLPVRDKRLIEKAFRRVMRGFSPSERLRHNGTLQATKETDRTRLKLLNELVHRDVSVVAIYLNKRRVHTHLPEEQHVLYNYVANILLDRIYDKDLLSHDDPIQLIASRRESNKLLTENFRDYLNGQVGGRPQLKIEVAVRPPQQEKGLQAVDMVSWALFRNRENGDDSYCNVIKPVIIDESPLIS
jgi:Protein of unknown function (DUF3800)